jgi:hypothetical protein
MFKLSILFKATVLALLIALLFASLPTTNVVAKETNQGLEKKWDQLVNNFTNQSSNHNAAHKWVDHWLKTHKKASSSEKAEVQKHLDICNSAIMSAGTIVSNHAGFDGEGNLVERASAIRSIKDLSYYLQRHAGSIRSLSEHVNK